MLPVVGRACAAIIVVAMAYGCVSGCGRREATPTPQSESAPDRAAEAEAWAAKNQRRRLPRPPLSCDAVLTVEDARRICGRPDLEISAGGGEGRAFRCQRTILAKNAIRTSVEIKLHVTEPRAAEAEPSGGGAGEDPVRYEARPWADGTVHHVGGHKGRHTVSVEVQEFPHRKDPRTCDDAALLALGKLIHSRLP